MAHTHESNSTRDRRAMARAGVLVVIGVAAALILATWLVLSHRPHTPTLAPGEPQRSAALTFNIG
jgi:hypothetical protein